MPTPFSIFTFPTATPRCFTRDAALTPVLSFRYFDDAFDSLLLLSCRHSPFFEPALPADSDIFAIMRFHISFLHARYAVTLMPFHLLISFLLPPRLRFLRHAPRAMPSPLAGFRHYSR
jgi:hypothetical protein